MSKFLILVSLFIPATALTQLRWTNVDAEFGPLPSSVHVFKTNDSLGGKPNIAYYLIADLSDKDLLFTVDTSRDRRMTPRQFHERNDKALAVVNTTFFSYETSRSLNAVIREGKLVGYNIHTINGRGKDTFTYRHPFGSAIGINKKRQADVAWLYTDSSMKFAYAREKAIAPIKDSSIPIKLKTVFNYWYPGTAADYKRGTKHSEWKMETAVGGGPVLVQDGQVSISNDDEIKFAGKAINDKHPRTAMGYTKEGKLIILVIEGRHPGKAEGADLVQEANMLKDIGCLEALNLDGGGSSCLLVNGKETIKISDAAGQRPVPAVFVIRRK